MVVVVIVGEVADAVAVAMAMAVAIAVAMAMAVAMANIVLRCNHFLAAAFSYMFPFNYPNV